jgi:hypothetical protein
LKNVANILNEFQPIALQQMEEVKLMNRTDIKYVLHHDLLHKVLPELLTDYKVLEIENKRCMSYKSLYYDTEDFNMYMNHQNGKRNRYKIRKRFYVDSNTGFFELKFKNNKGRTIKKRIGLDLSAPSIDIEKYRVIEDESPYQFTNLSPVTANQFERITLVNAQHKERITIDINLIYDRPQMQIKMENLVIIEVKKTESHLKTKIMEVLLSQRVKTQGFSKYLVGTMLLYPELKYNRVKSIMLRLKKLNIEPLKIQNNEPDISNQLIA